MKVAVIGSCGMTVDALEKYLPPDTTEIVSGGAKGIDACAERYAREKVIPVKIFLPNYAAYGRNAPLKRNLQIIGYADTVLAFWDGISRGTAFVIAACRQCGKPIRVIGPAGISETEHNDGITSRFSGHTIPNEREE